jgi:hypothetical protein
MWWKYTWYKCVWERLEVQFRFVLTVSGNWTYKFDRDGALVELGRFKRILQTVNDIVLINMEGF